MSPYSTRTRTHHATEGSALILVLMAVTAMMVLTVVTVDMSRSHAVAERTGRDSLLARQIAESGAAQALARIKEAGVSSPASGGGANGVWVPFGAGEFLYYTNYNMLAETSTIRAWGRVPVDSTVSSATVAPDAVGWDALGYMLEGIEVTVKSLRYIPEAPAYFGNGGIEKPLGGFEWGTGVDPADPSTWQLVTSESSYQTDAVPFQISALNHPPDYLYNGGTPAAAAIPHDYKIWVSQNKIGQFNTDAWFKNSAGTSDPATNVFPSPYGTSYDYSDFDSPDHPYAVDPYIPDVQDFGHELWKANQSNGAAVFLSGGSYSGTYGDYTTPNVTFVTGGLDVPSGQTFEGAGILVIRDDYDPNVDTNNQPSTRAGLTISGDFRWTGLVVISGWAPAITVESGGDATIVGTLLGEDSVQSGGETSLDSATINFYIKSPLRILYSNDLFQSGGLIQNAMPKVSKEVVGIREI